MGKRPGKGGGKQRRPGGGPSGRDVDAIRLHRGRLFAVCQELVAAADAGTAHLSEHEQRIVEQMRALAAVGFKPKAGPSHQDRDLGDAAEAAPIGTATTPADQLLQKPPALD